MQEQKEGEGTQVVSEQLRRVLFYLSSRTSRADGGESVCVCVCVCVCVPGVSMAASPGTLLGHITYVVQ